MHSLSISTARRDFTGLFKVAGRKPVLVTRHGRPTLVVLSADQYEGMQITIEILRDWAFAKHLRRSVTGALAGER
jgi:prevent-host-death family protein